MAPLRNPQQPLKIQSQNTAISACKLKPASIHSGAQTASRSNAVPNASPKFKVSNTENMVRSVLVGSSVQQEDKWESS